MLRIQSFFACKNNKIISEKTFDVLWNRFRFAKSNAEKLFKIKTGFDQALYSGATILAF